MTMVRKQIYIEPQQEAKLKKLSKRVGKSEAELIRQAIDQLELDSEAQTGRHSASWLKALEIINRRRATLPLSDGGRTWTREELYEGRPKYLSR